MKALVTGGTGFIGSHVVKQLLDENHTVRIFSRKKDIPEILKEKGVDVFQGDLEDAQSLINALDNIDVFYHIGEIKNRSKASSEKNVRLVEETIRHLGEKKIKRIVFVSSITVSGIPSAIPANEDTAPRIVLSDHYTEYKMRCEKLIRGNAGDVEYVIIRPAPVYGPGSRYLGRLIDILDKFGPVGIPFAGNAKNIAPLIYVRDLAQAICRAGMEQAAAGRIFIVTDGLRHSWSEFFNAITEGLGKKLRIIPVPPFFLQIAALPLNLFSGFLGINLDPVSYITYFSQDLYFDNTRAKDILNWQPQYSLQEGVKDMIGFYKKDVKGGPL